MKRAILPSIDKQFVLKGNVAEISEKKTADVNQTDWSKLFEGKIEKVPSLPSNEIRIFLSSTFSDFKMERNFLIKKVFQEVKQLCNANGIEFRLCDMRWGVTDYSVNEHQVEKLCFQEIDRCHSSSLGPFFVALIGNRYGYRPIPIEFSAKDFDKIVELMNEVHSKTVPLLKSWYVEDSNAIPAKYILQPVQSKLPSYTDYNDEAKRRDAGNEWWAVQENIRHALSESVELGLERGVFTMDEAHKWLCGVTDAEVSRALFEKVEARKRSLVIFRDLLGLEKRLTDPAAGKYADVILINDQPAIPEDCRKLFYYLKKSISDSLVPTLTYQISWYKDGLSLSNDLHFNYLQKLQTDVTLHLTEAIQHSVAQRNAHLPQLAWKRDLVTEIHHHLQFLKFKIAHFCGRVEELESVRQLWLVEKVKHPILVQANSGVGKTAFVAKVAAVCGASWFAAADCVLCVRFLGTSASSANIYSTLYSLALQITLAYNIHFPFKEVQNITSLKAFLPSLFRTVSRQITLLQKPSLVILLDAVDQLAAANAAHSLHWLPMQLPAGVHILLSVVRDRADIVQVFQRRLSKGQKSTDVALECFPTTEVDVFLQQQMHAKSRQLTTDQMAVVCSAVQQSEATPLLMKLIMDQALLWHSYTAVDNLDVTLFSTVEQCIQHMFHTVELRYGECMVRHALSFLTAGLDGLSEVELEDALSCNDEVLNAVYQYHDPPQKDVIRIPPLLWSRLHGDLADYIVERRTDQHITLYWYHRQFVAAATSRYLSEDRCQEIHCQLADLFMAESPLKRSIVLANTKRRLELKFADRLISFQPGFVGHPRKLRATAHHLLKCGQLDLALGNVFCNVHFLYAYIKQFGIQVKEECVDLFKLGVNTFPNCLLLERLHSCFVFLQPQLETNPLNLPVQLLGQIRGHRGFALERVEEVIPLTEQMCVQCDQFLQDRLPAFLSPNFACFPTCFGPSKWSIEEVVETFTDPREQHLLAFLVLNSNSIRKPWSLRVMNIHDGRVLNTFSVEKKPLKCQIISAQSLVAVMDERNVTLFDIDSGQPLGEHGLLINNKIMLNKCLSVSHDANWIAVAAESRIALLEYQFTDSGSYPINYRCILSSRDIKTTELLHFTPILLHHVLISIHCDITSAASDRKIILVKSWNCDQKQELFTVNLSTVSAFVGDRIFIQDVPMRDEMMILLENGTNYHLHCLTGKPMVVLTTNDNDPPISTSLNDAESFRLQSVQNNSAEEFLCATLLHERSGVFLLLINYNPDRQIDNDHDDVSVPTGLGAAVQQFFHLHNTPPGFVLSAALLSYSGWSVFALQDGRVFAVNLHLEKFGKPLLQQDMTVESAVQLVVPWKHSKLLHAHSGRVPLLFWQESATVGLLYSFSQHDQVLKLWDLAHIGRERENKLALFEDNSLPIAMPTTYCVTADRKQFFSPHGSGGLGVWCVRTARMLAYLTDWEVGENAAPIMPLWSTMKQAHLFKSDMLMVAECENGLFVLDVTQKQVLTRWEPPAAAAAASSKSGKSNYLFMWKKHPSGDVIIVLSSQPKDRYVSLQLLSLPTLSLMQVKRFLPPLGLNVHDIMDFHCDPDKTGDCVMLHCLNNGNNNNNNNNNNNSSSNNRSSGGYGNGQLWKLHLREAGSTVGLSPCSNPEVEKSKQRSRAKPLSEASQAVYSCVIYQDLIHDQCMALIGGLGEIYQWHLTGPSPLAVMPKIPYFHTWFKHTMTVYNCKSKPSVSKDGSTRGLEKRAISSIAIADREASIVASGDSAGHVVVWWWGRLLDELETLREPVAARRYRLLLPEKHSGRVTALAFTLDGVYVISAGDDRQLFLFHLESGNVLHRVRTHLLMTQLHCLSLPHEEEADPADPGNVDHVIMGHGMHLKQPLILSMSLLRSS